MKCTLINMHQYLALYRQSFLPSKATCIHYLYHKYCYCHGFFFNTNNYDQMYFLYNYLLYNSILLITQLRSVIFNDMSCQQQFYNLFLKVIRILLLKIVLGKEQLECNLVMETVTSIQLLDLKYIFSIFIINSYSIL